MERRKYPRFAAQQAIEVTFDREVFLDVEGVDISEGGVQCRCSRPLDPQSRLYLMLALPRAEGTYTIRTEATVMWSRSKGGKHLFGASFDPLTGEDAAALQAYMSSLPPAAGGP